MSGLSFCFLNTFLKTEKIKLPFPKTTFSFFKTHVKPPRKSKLCYNNVSILFKPLFSETHFNISSFLQNLFCNTCFSKTCLGMFQIAARFSSGHEEEDQQQHLHGRHILWIINCGNLPRALVQAGSTRMLEHIVGPSAMRVREQSNSVNWVLAAHGLGT